MCKSFTENIKEAFLRELPELKVCVFDSVGSTSDEARTLGKLGGGRAAFFIAKEQTSGRGRRGRSFVSREGGLYLSYLLHPTLAAHDSIMLTVFSAVALCEVIEEITGAAPGIKWVNDVFLGGKKLAGILAEGEFSEDGEKFNYAVVGIGVNLHGTVLDGQIDSIATTLERETGVRVDIADFAVKLAKKLLAFEEKSSLSYMEAYRARSVILGKRVKMTSAGEEFFAEVSSIEDDGAILVRLDSGEEKKLYSAEVSVILA